LFTLKPLLDEEGLLRSDGRTTYAEYLPFDVFLYAHEKLRLRLIDNYNYNYVTNTTWDKRYEVPQGDGFHAKLGRKALMC